jgi:hypothetical protein
MIIDSLLEFADAESVAAGAGTALIGDVIDLGGGTGPDGVTTFDPHDLGNGKPMYLVITVDTSIITGGSAGTIRFQLASDAQAAIATNGSATVHWDSGTFVTDGDDANELDAGAVVYVGALPTDSFRTYERYLGILATIATTTVTAGAINAFLTSDPYAWKALQDANN